MEKYMKKKGQGVPEYRDDRNLENFRLFQYAECIDKNYPQLRGKALPIVSYELAWITNVLIGVKCMLHEGHYQWFDVRQVRLYRGRKEWLTVQHRRHERGTLRRLLRGLGLKP
jgi:hypothetical protein